eukprot:TRINITY_DN30690_c0_g1_i1.p1 TRINITY_DN30690_c0_g1~~TRINITY_DN30690_c0_g1_i1.p1  ORF type:complete len:581 (+),score=101.76 TRINITY_DN30690_c0_g1_i1:57-1745(+)
MAAQLANCVDGKERCALIVCDALPDVLQSIPAKERATLLSALRICVSTARAAGWLVIFSGLRFPAGYAGVNKRHRHFGGLKRLNEKVGDKGAHWFMEGYFGGEIDPSLSPQGGDVVVWRQRHLPPAELLECLQERGITKVVVSGLKASYSVQATCQVLCDEGLEVTVVRECLQDDVPERLAAMLESLLPIYADVVGWEEFLEDLGIEAVDPVQDADASAADAGGVAPTQTQFYCTDCKRGGHSQRFCEYLLERPGWNAYPTQKWFQDEFWKEYYCPLAKKVVDFADEPQFSKISMYLQGRDWLDDKTKVMELAADYMAETFIIENGQWKGKVPPSDDEAPRAPWFVKEADKNWGNNVHCCLRPSECIGLTKPGAQYVVQQHIPDPLLTDDGKKCHIKFYNLLVGMEDGTTWNLYTYTDGYLCISPNTWNPDDISAETQVTIIRDIRLSEVKCWNAWPEAYPRCKACVVDVMQKAVQSGKLQHRPGQKQFEVFSADFIIDTSGRPWLFEFNMSPVLKDAKDSSTVDDSAMIRGALSIVIPWENGDKALWDLAADFRSDAAASS